MASATAVQLLWIARGSIEIGERTFKDYLPKEISGAMKQRVALARVLILKPKVLLMDEPFGALDAQTREEMQNLLLSLWQDLSHTIVFVTHDLRARSIINLHFYAPINPASTPNNVNLFLSEP